ncbi:MAG: hypothetical protein ACE5ID_01760 [Acidobacteriota bacterium]
MTDICKTLVAAALLLAPGVLAAETPDEQVILDTSAVVVHISEDDLNALISPYTAGPSGLVLSGYKNILKGKFREVDYQIDLDDARFSLQPGGRVVFTTRMAAASIHAGSIYKLKKNGRPSRLQCHDLAIDLDPDQPVSIQVILEISVDDGKLNIVSGEVNLSDGSDGFQVQRPATCKGAWILNPLVKTLVRRKIKKTLRDLDRVLGSIFQKEIAALGALPAAESEFSFHSPLENEAVRFSLRPSALGTSHGALHLSLALEKASGKEDSGHENERPPRHAGKPHDTLDGHEAPRTAPGRRTGYPEASSPAAARDDSAPGWILEDPAATPLYPGGAGRSIPGTTPTDQGSSPSLNQSYIALSRQALNHLFDSMVSREEHPPLQLTATGRVAGALRSDLFKDLFPMLDQVPAETSLIISLGLSTSPIISLQNDTASGGVVIDVTTRTGPEYRGILGAPSFQDHNDSTLNRHRVTPQDGAAARTPPRPPLPPLIPPDARTAPSHHSMLSVDHVLPRTGGKDRSMATLPENAAVSVAQPSPRLEAKDQSLAASPESFARDLDRNSDSSEPSHPTFSDHDDRTESDEDGHCPEEGFQLQLWDGSGVALRSLGSVFIGPHLRFSASLTPDGRLALQVLQSKWQVCSASTGRQSRILSALLQTALTPLSLNSRLRPLDFPILRMGQRHLQAVRLEVRGDELLIGLRVVPRAH